MRGAADQCDQQGIAFVPVVAVSRWLAQGGTGAVEEAGVSSGQAHWSGGGRDNQSPADQSIGTAAEGPLRPPAQQDSKLPQQPGESNNMYSA